MAKNNKWQKDRNAKKRQKFVEDVKELGEKLGHDPYLWEICEHMGGSATSNKLMIKNSIPWYPKKLLITPALHKAMINYKKGMDIKDLAKACGVVYSGIYTLVDDLKRVGIDIRKNEMPSYTKNVKNVEHYLPDVFMYITDGIGEGQLVKITKITDVYHVKLNDGRIVTKEGWQLREPKIQEKLMRERKI